MLKDAIYYIEEYKDEYDNDWSLSCRLQVTQLMQNCLVRAIQISLLAFILYMTVRYTDKDEEKR